MQVWDAARVLIKAAEPLTTSDTKTVAEWTRQMATLPQASKLATRILLLTLLFEVSYLHNLSEVIIYLFLKFNKYCFSIMDMVSSTPEDLFTSAFKGSVSDLSVCSALFPDRS